VELDLEVLDETERIGFLLRSLYQQHGFSRYRMSKFEEYDLYSRNKDFLLSDGVLTFTDTNGRLMALKPDVTLSIVKNGRDCPSGVQKVYYHENVYRSSDAEEGFREETQVGVECMGQVDGPTVSEVLNLAAESLQMLSGEYVLEISQLDLLGALVDSVAIDETMRTSVLRCAEQKNLHGIREICREAGLPEGAEKGLINLLECCGSPKRVMPEIRKIAEEYGCEEAARQLGQCMAGFIGSEAEKHLWIDFSSTGDLKYYNGIALKGFLKGIPVPVLSGGQYDALLKRMHRKDRAIGFAVFLHRLERLTREGGEV
jgi:ATP phosphoribosyltransferase regulatory subunit